MKRWKLRLRIVAVALTVCLLCCTTGLAKKPDNTGGGGGAAYTIIPAAPFELDSEAYFSDMNANGTAAIGSAELPSGERRDFHYDVTNEVYTTFTDGRILNGVNNLSQMAGSINGKARFWDGVAAAPIDLDPLPGDLVSYATAINDDGIVLGVSLSGAEGAESVGVVWRVNPLTLAVEGPYRLPLLPDDVYGRGRDLSEVDGGLALATGVSGTETASAIEEEAVVWVIEIDENGLAPPLLIQGLDTQGLFAYSHATGLNGSGDVVGRADAYPFISRPGESMQHLPLARDASLGTAYDINEAGDIVGFLKVPVKGWKRAGGLARAFLWKDGSVIDLGKKIDPQSGWAFLESAIDIAENGVISGYGRFEDGTMRGFLMIPNP